MHVSCIRLDHCKSCFMFLCKPEIQVGCQQKCPNCFNVTNYPAEQLYLSVKRGIRQIAETFETTLKYSNYTYMCVGTYIYLVNIKRCYARKKINFSRLWRIFIQYESNVLLIITINLRFKAKFINHSNIFHCLLIKSTLLKYLTNQQVNLVLDILNDKVVHFINKCLWKWQTLQPWPISKYCAVLVSLKQEQKVPACKSYLFL